MTMVTIQKKFGESGSTYDAGVSEGETGGEDESDEDDTILYKDIDVDDSTCMTWICSYKLDHLQSMRILNLVCRSLSKYNGKGSFRSVQYPMATQKSHISRN